MNPRKSFKVVVSIITLGAIGTLAVIAARSGVARPKASQSPGVIRAKTSMDPAFLRSLAESQDIKVELITVRPTGFEPSQITRAAGKFVIGLADRTGLPGLQFFLLNQNDETVHEFSSGPGKVNVREMVDLPAGQYSHREAAHSWTCTITITAQ